MDQVSDFIATEMDRLYPDGVYPFSTLPRKTWLGELADCPKEWPEPTLGADD